MSALPGPGDELVRVLHAPPLGTDTPLPPPEEAHEGERFAQTAEAFAAELEITPPPMLGSASQMILPQHGLAILAGRPGIGKTTLALDLAFSLASGQPWPRIDAEAESPPEPLAVAKPLRVMLIENEGPPALFRQKIREKIAAWQHSFDPEQLWVQVWRWGGFSFAQPDALQRAGEFLDERRIDLVIGDPLRSLGAQGAGSPEDTLAFTRLLVRLGLWERRAFMFLHHFRKDPSSDEIDQLSGAWGGHLDSLLVLKAAVSGEQLRLSYPKLRWAHEERPPMILGKIRALAAFEYLGDEGDGRFLEQAIVALLADGKARTAAEIGGKSEGIGARRAAVKAALEGNPHLFEQVSGAEVGRSARAQCWRLSAAAAAAPEGPLGPLGAPLLEPGGSSNGPGDLEL